MANEPLTYLYEAIDGSGKRVKGEVESTSDVRAYQTVIGRGLTPVKVKAKPTAGLQMDISIPGFEGHVKTKSLAVFSKQFGVLIKAGMPLVRSLEVITEQTEDKLLKTALAGTLSDVEKGLPLSEAMSRHPNAFPPLMINLIHVGEEGGFLDKTLASIAKTYKSELELKNKIKSAMTYPVIVGALAIVIVIAMLIFVVPVFQNMFKDLDAELPAPTQFLINISQNMAWITPLIVIAIMGSVFFTRKYKNEEWFRSRMDPLKLRMPVFGKLSLKVSIARFSRNLAMMLAAGVPLMNALQLVGGAANNWVIESALEKAVRALSAGRSFADTLKKTGVFPAMVSDMILVGEESGSLPDMLDSVADFYEDEVKESADALASAMEPLMIMVIGVLVGGMIVALYMPMFSMFSEISG